MAETAEKFEELIVPEGGIADFVGTEEEVEAMEAEDAKKEFGEAGIAEFSDVAKRMAGYGRFGDDTLAHVETGELIIPRALIEGNEKLREDIFNNLREQGVEDPERYVVGSEANSLNPDTGLPEFFFKKLFKGISKAFKGVVKVFKKIAPIVLPMVLGPLVGPIAAGALGSGIATLMNGGDLGDALKAGLTGGLMGAASSFGGGFLKGFQKGGFQGGISGGIGSLKASVGSMFGGARTPAPVEFKQAASSSGSAASTPVISESMPELAATAGVDSANITPLTPSIKPENLTSPTSPISTADVAAAATRVPPKPTTPDFNTFASKPPVTSKVPVTSGDGFFSKAQNLFFPDPKTDPSFLRQYGPLAVAGLGVAGAAGGFERPKFEPELPEGFELTGAQLYEQNPQQYTPRINYGPAPTISDVRTESRFGDVVSTAPQSFYQPYPFTRPEGEGSVFDRPMITMAEGGEVFPRRNGGIMPNEGTPGEDSVRAMLMPGEFVMTTDAVRGAGNGNLNKGINNMYSVMRNLESRGRAS